MKTLYYNGIFHTMDPATENQKVDAVICENGKLIAVGSQDEFNSDLLMDAVPKDLNGAHVLPGFIDTYSAPAIAAFDVAAREEGLTSEDGLYWVKEAMDHLNDHGVSVLCLLGEEMDEKSKFLQIVGMDDASIIYDMEYRNDFVKALDGSPADLYDGFYESILENPRTSNLLLLPILNDCETTEEAIRKLTTDAASSIGREDMGSITLGKRANLTLFEENPFDSPLSMLAHIHAQRIVCDGEIVYDVYEQAMAELYELLSQQTF